MKSKFAGSVALLVTGILSPALWNATAAEAANSYVPFDGEKTTWHDGFDRYDYLMDETTFAIAPFKRAESEKFAVGNPPKGQRRCIIVAPKQAARDNPWSWQGYYYSLESTNVWLKEEKTWANCRGPGFVECYDRYDETTSSQWGLTGLAVIVPKTVARGKPWVFRADAITRDAAIDQALLARGFHIVIPPLTAQSGAVKTQWNNAYELMTSHGFSKTPVMEGTGTAAGEAYAWAIENPDKVACIVGHNPALRSLVSKTAPLENLATLAKAGVPLLHVCDKRDPWFNDQTKVVEQRYNELGGQITVVINEDDARYSLASADQSRVLDFIVGKAK